MLSFIFSNLFNLLGIGGLMLVLILIFFTDPFEAPSLVLYLFYLGLFFAIFGIYFLFEYNLRKRLFKLQTPSSHFKKALVDSFLLAISCCLLLFLQMIRVLELWDALLLIITLFLLKLYFSSRKTKK